MCYEGVTDLARYEFSLQPGGVEDNLDFLRILTVF